MDARIERIHSAGAIQRLGPAASNRFVVSPDELSRQSPFVLLVEDFIGPDAEFHQHPHRGFETVTFILDGELEHADHLGNAGILFPGDVQWMTAGSGILHGGRPHGSRPVHALQLWLNLPGHLKMSEPRTREQRLSDALERRSRGLTVRTYGARSTGPGSTPWSRWPMTLTDLDLSSGCETRLKVASDERLFIYLLVGELEVGTRGTRMTAGDVAWFFPDSSDAPGMRDISLRASRRAHAISYAGRPIRELVVVRGPFVMNTDAEIDRAYTDLSHDTFLRFPS